ncbi:beta-galactosidase [Bacteroidia bacterium]|nr:beta-galactosidase [Bacteroidia bacterium]
MNRKRLFLILPLLIFASTLPAKEIPYLKRNNQGVVQLIADGKPLMMLAGEVMNSSASTLESMAPKWETLKKLNLNTVLLPVAWEQVEPEEGQYDFSIVGGLIQEARKHDLKLVFLWFGSWKNGSSGYAPHWVMRDTKRFPRMRTKNGENRPFLSNFTDELAKADTKVFGEMMKYIKEVDSEEHTVLMIQIENEVGLLGDSRDRSLQAEELFKKEVPEDLVKYFQKNEKQILPEIIEQWKAHGKKTKGNWLELFGNESHNLADELFMGWYYARFINQVAAAGKKAYPIPLFVNAWTIYPKDPVPGNYPSGGPNARMLDVYQFAAPSVDFIAPDNYNDDYGSKLKEFDRNGNPIFVPEAVALWRGEKWSGPAKAFYTFGEFNALGFSPFAIDNSVYDEKHPLKDAYRVLNNLMPLIVKEQGSGKMRGFMQQESKRDKIDFGDYEMFMNYNHAYPGYGLVIRLSDDEFLVSGNGVDISFRSKKESLTGISYGTIREGYFVNGVWNTSKYLGGDEAMQGVGGVKIPPVYLGEDATQNLVSTVIIKVIPVESSTYSNKNIFDQVK